jgi:uncharacterized protein (UPF0335 family)
MNFAKDSLKSFVSRIENVETEIKELNSDKSDIYSEAKANGFDVRALKAVVARRRKDPNEVAEHDALVDLYLSTLNGKSETGTLYATRVHAREGDTATASDPLAIPADLSIPPYLRRQPAEAV